MDLIRISDRKLKIMLTPMDMCHFELNNDSLGEDTAKMHRSFRLLLDEIRRRTDFDADDKHLSIQYFPSREGGCEMFISHLRGEEQDVRGEGCQASKPTSHALLPKPVKKQNGSFRKECAYRFFSLSSLLRACKRLIGLGSITESTAYCDERGDYLLFLTFFSNSPFSTPEELDFLVEYGFLENVSLLRLYIREHASLIASPDAISALGVLI